VKLNKKWIVLVLLLVGLANCRTSPLTNHHGIGIASASGKPFTTEQVKLAIIRGGADRNWSMNPAGPGHLIGTLSIRSHVTIVDIEYDAEKYSITYKDSTNMSYSKDSDGTENIHANYIGWINFLKKSINRELLRM